MHIFILSAEPAYKVLELGASLRVSVLAVGKQYKVVVTVFVNHAFSREPRIVYIGIGDIFNILVKRLFDVFPVKVAAHKRYSLVWSTLKGHDRHRRAGRVRLDGLFKK